LKRGQVITVAFTGDYGKPRPAVVIQSDLLPDSGTILLCQITSELAEVSIRRVAVEATPATGLLKPSQIMVEKIFAVKRERIGNTIGQLERDTLTRLNEALALVTGLLDPR
jgi:mRNA interferase MazF